MDKKLFSVVEYFIKENHFPTLSYLTVNEVLDWNKQFDNVSLANLLEEQPKEFKEKVQKLINSKIKKKILNEKIKEKEPERILVEFYKKNKPEDFYSIISDSAFDFNVMYKSYKYGLSPLDCVAHTPYLVLSDEKPIDEQYKVYKKIIKFLIEKEIDLQKSNIFGVTPVQIALIDHNYLFLETILKDKKIDLSKVLPLNNKFCEFYRENLSSFHTFKKDEHLNNLKEIESGNNGEKQTPLFLSISAHATNWINEALAYVDSRNFKSVVENFDIREQDAEGKTIFHYLCNSYQGNFNFYKQALLYALTEPNFEEAFNYRNKYYVHAFFSIEDRYSILREPDVLKNILPYLHLNMDETKKLFSIKEDLEGLENPKDDTCVKLLGSYLETERLKREVDLSTQSKNNIKMF